MVERQRKSVRPSLAGTRERETGRPSKRRHHNPPAPGQTEPTAGLPLLRTSERGTFKRCHWKWWWEFERNAKPMIDVPPLRFGTLLHSALATYYKPGVRRGPHPRPVFESLYLQDLERVCKETKRSPREIEDEAGWGEHCDLGIDMLEHYIERYGKDEEWEVLVTEFPFRTIVQYPNGAPWFWYVGILDGVWKHRTTARIVIPDHKSTRAINLRYLKLDDQATSYWTWGVDALINARLLPPGIKLHGMLFNFLRKAKKDTRPQDADGRYLNKDGKVSQKQPSPYHHRELVLRDWNERENARKRVLREWQAMDTIRRQGRQEVDGKNAIPGAPFKNPGQFTCPGCWLFDICELHEIGADWRELAQLTTKSWDPYAEHEIRESR